MEIVPFESVGELLFGTSRESVRRLLGGECTPFRKHADASEIEVCETRGLHLYFDDDDKLEFVEGFEPAEITFQGIEFLGRALATVIADMRSLGFASLPADVGVDFPTAGIALTAPTGVVEGVAAHRKGYYDT